MPSGTRSIMRRDTTLRGRLLAMRLEAAMTGPGAAAIVPIRVGAAVVGEASGDLAFQVNRVDMVPSKARTVGRIHTIVDTRRLDLVQKLRQQPFHTWSEAWE